MQAKNNIRFSENLQNCNQNTRKWVSFPQELFSKKYVFHGNNYGKKELKRTRKGATIYRVPSIAG